jgi:hypothetical protein
MTASVYICIKFQIIADFVDNVSEWGNMSIRRLFLSELAH